MISQSVPKIMCPSADIDMPESAIFGIVVGTPESPNLVYLDRAKPISADLLALDAPVKPSEIFRIAATCVEWGCKHFDGAECRLVERIVDRLPPVLETIPDCAIRASCRWWNQQGTAACLRCSQIVRDNYISSEDLMLEVVDPQA